MSGKLQLPLGRSIALGTKERQRFRPMVTLCFLFPVRMNLVIMAPMVVKVTAVAIFFTRRRSTDVGLIRAMPEVRLTPIIGKHSRVLVAMERHFTLYEVFFPEVQCANKT